MERVAEFWSWWAGARSRYESGQETTRRELRDELDERVAALHEKLAWEIGGAPGDWQLVLSPEGDPALRGLTARWAAAAPADPGWQYLGARPRRTDLTFAIAIDGRRIRLGDARFALLTDSDRDRVNVTVFHKGFGGASDELRRFAALLVLANVLGEDDVERWIGRIGAEATKPWFGVHKAEGLRAEVDRVAARAAARRAAGQRSWANLRMANAEGQEAWAMIDYSLRRLDHLDHEHHLEVVYSYPSTNELGLPTKELHRAGNDLEQALEAAAGERAVHYGHMVGEGKLAMWFYAPAREPVDAAIAELVARHGLTTEWTEDPAWERLARF